MISFCTNEFLIIIISISLVVFSGYGENSVENIYSKIYSADARLDPYRVPAGYFTEGTNYYNNRHLSKFDGKCYIDSDGEYTTNENTIYGNAAMVFLTAAVMAQEHDSRIAGDVNGDGVCNTVDVVIMQKWLLAVPGTTLADWKAGDLCEDNRLDIMDLCYMKRMLKKQ